MVKRYNPWNDYWMVESPKGEYVKYEDYKELEERLSNAGWREDVYREEIDRLSRYERDW